MVMKFRILKQQKRLFLAKLEIYENSCQALDIISDRQMRTLLASDNITIINRSFSFNAFRAFATAIEENLESLTLHSTGLTSRSVNVLCQGLNKCVHLNLLVKPNKEINLLHFFCITNLSSRRIYQIIKSVSKVLNQLLIRLIIFHH